MSCNKKGHNVCSGLFSYHKLLRLTLDSSSKYSLHKFFPVQLFRDHYVEYFEWEKRTKEKHYDLSNQSFFSNQSRIIWWGWHGKYRLSCIALVISILWGEKWKKNMRGSSRLRGEIYCLSLSRKTHPLGLYFNDTVESRSNGPTIYEIPPKVDMNS